MSFISCKYFVKTILQTFKGMKIIKNINRPDFIF